MSNCACVSPDRYECFRRRNIPMDDLLRREWELDNEVIEDNGGPCECDCHNERED
jgi:hypothetical protein